jgi:uncharacterized membrane protein YgcG
MATGSIGKTMAQTSTLRDAASRGMAGVVAFNACCFGVAVRHGVICCAVRAAALFAYISCGWRPLTRALWRIKCAARRCASISKKMNRQHGVSLFARLARWRKKKNKHAHRVRAACARQSDLAYEKIVAALAAASKRRCGGGGGSAWRGGSMAGVAGGGYVAGACGASAWRAMAAASCR